MAATKTALPDGARKPRVGDRVRFRFVLRDVVGTITEDRGPLGAGGRHLYEVTAPQEWADPILIELPSDQMTLLNDEPPDRNDSSAVDTSQMADAIVAKMA